MRWLESQGKHDKVINALKKIAAVNKKPFPDLPTNTHVQVILFKTKLTFYYNFTLVEACSLYSYL